jgi:hypothetical protein
MTCVVPLHYLRHTFTGALLEPEREGKKPKNQNFGPERMGQVGQRPGRKPWERFGGPAEYFWGSKV